MTPLPAMEAGAPFPLFGAYTNASNPSAQLGGTTIFSGKIATSCPSPPRMRAPVLDEKSRFLRSAVSSPAPRSISQSTRYGALPGAPHLSIPRKSPPSPRLIKPSRTAVPSSYVRKEPLDLISNPLPFTISLSAPSPLNIPPPSIPGSRSDSPSSFSIRMRSSPASVASIDLTNPVLLNRLSLIKMMSSPAPPSIREKRKPSRAVKKSSPAPRKNFVPLEVFAVLAKSFPSSK